MWRRVQFESISVNFQNHVRATRAWRTMFKLFISSVGRRLIQLIYLLFNTQYIYYLIYLQFQWTLNYVRRTRRGNGQKTMEWSKVQQIIFVQFSSSVFLYLYLTDCLWRCLFTRMLCEVSWHCPHVPTPLVSPPPTPYTGDNRQRNLTPHLSAAACRLLIMNSFIICCSQRLCTNTHGQYWQVWRVFLHQSIIEELLNMSHKILVSTVHSIYSI